MRSTRKFFAVTVSAALVATLFGCHPNIPSPVSTGVAPTHNRPSSVQIGTIDADVRDVVWQYAGAKVGYVEVLPNDPAVHCGAVTITAAASDPFACAANATVVMPSGVQTAPQWRNLRGAYLRYKLFRYYVATVEGFEAVGPQQCAAAYITYMWLEPSDTPTSKVYQELQKAIAADGSEISNVTVGMTLAQGESFIPPTGHSLPINDRNNPILGCLTA